MGEIFESILEVLNAFLLCGSVAMATVVIIVAYFALMTYGLPLVLKVRYRRGRELGRGVKRFVFPNGRGVLYEPDPAYRKYVPLYTLVCREGYKLLRLKLDSAVRALSYKVVMFNNADKVIDVLSVRDAVKEKNLSNQVLLHEDTSYVALILQTVNGVALPKKSYRYYRLADLLIYGASVAVTSFLMFVAFRWAANSVAAFLEEGAVIGRIGSYFFPSLCIGALIGLMAFWRGKKQGIGVKIYDKK